MKNLGNVDGPKELLHRENLERKKEAEKCCLGSGKTTSREKKEPGKGGT